MNTSTINTTKPAKRPANFTKAAWENDTFRVYNGLVKLVKGEITLSQFTTHPTVKSLMSAVGMANTPEERQKATVNLIISMAKDRTSHGEKERHIAPIYRLRAFFNGAWKDYAARPVTYNEPKAPKAPAKKTAQKAKKPVKKVQNVSLSQWVKGLTDEQFDTLRVEMAMRDIVA